MPESRRAARLLAVNAGSSSIRLDILANVEGAWVASARQKAGADAASPEALLREFLQRPEAGDVDAVAHRVVHGGADLGTACRVTPEVERVIERYIPLAPLHNPAALAWIRACRALLGERVAQVAVLDTGFFADLPAVARTYPLPHEVCAQHGIRRYGFHGIAHQAMWQRWCALRPGRGGRARAITLQLGSGCSAAAIRDGRARDTSMGFTPLEGLMMATRSGDLDPGLLVHLQKAAGLEPRSLERMLNAASGLRGVSGRSGDMRGLLAADDPASRLAVDLYCYRARKYVGAYMAALGGTDAILFGGGVGERSAAVRAGILEGMAWAGVVLDPAVNRRAEGVEACIGRGPVDVWVMPVDEARVLAEEGAAALAREG